MKKNWLMMAIVLGLVVTGCSKKNEGTSTTTPIPTTGATVQPSAGASATPSGTSGGTTATASPQAGSKDAAKDEPLPQITKEQVDKISTTDTYDDLVKQTGAKGKLVKDENGKKTYDFEISNQPGYILEVVYFADGKISEKQVFRK
ncbi:hypothetical protein BC351_06780 [Paenibacillus ferrarius]|uniref:PepSY domain-containing protein n=1 Tax=Paenibacillus ferrarius TaxID=1469647 RepID=A0A1V4HGK5_9BACL|nr:hypothetical protein [Paenibacillus ferrarius]OPH53562.1 hypothetical protein BC351_06780 [Paenibacillus ferrarius]